MDLVVSLGGKIVSEAVESGNLPEYVEALEELQDGTDTLVIVTGAGDLKRYIAAASDFEVSEAWKDLIGIKATRLHAAALSSALGANVPVPEDLEAVAELSENHEVIVLGGLLPGQSTDAVAAQCAEIVDADRLVLATTVDGVYDSDPEENGDAELYDELGYEELLELVAEHETSAGGYPLVDLLAAKLVQRSGIETVVLDGRDPAVLSQGASAEPSGTLVH